MTRAQATRPAAALGAVIAALAACSATGPKERASDRGPGAEHPAGWEALPESPLSPRAEAAAFWLGDRVVVLGGTDAPPCPPNADCAAPVEPPLRDGATFDPSTGTWAPIAAAPVPLGSVSGAVHAGTLYVSVPASGLAPAGGAQGAFLAYHPADDRWEELPRPPAPADARLRLVATDAAVVAYHSTQELGVLPDLEFEPGSGAWRELPPDPLAPSFDRAMVWSADRLVLIGVEVVPDPNGRRPALYRAAALGAALAAWQRFPDSSIVAWNPSWYATSGLVVNPSLGTTDGGTVNNWGRAFPHGGVLDPARGAWADLPPAPPTDAAYHGLNAAGPEHAVSSEGAVLDVAARRWIPLPRPPGAADSGAAVTWAGDRLFVWGGARSSGGPGELVGSGFTWRP